jgi:hypothetical protein
MIHFREMGVFRQVDADRDFPGVISHNAFLRTIRALRESSLLLYDLHLIVRSPR